VEAKLGSYLTSAQRPSNGNGTQIRATTPEKSNQLHNTPDHSRFFVIFHFPQKKNQDTLYLVWNEHGYINLLIFGVVNAQTIT
jgi:hypothetical protein